MNTINAEQSRIMNTQMMYHFGAESISSMPTWLFIDRYNELCNILFDRAFAPNEDVYFNPQNADVRWDGSAFNVTYE